MKTKILSLTLITFLSFSVQAQFGGLMDKAKKKAEEKAEKEKKEAEKKAENKIDAPINTSGSGSNSNSNSGSNPNTNSNSTGNSNSGAKVTPVTTSKREFKKKFVAPSEMSEFHKKNIGRIVFASPSTEKEAKDYPNVPNDFQLNNETTVFKFREPLYGCFYMPDCLGNIPIYPSGDSTQPFDYNSTHTFNLKIYFDDKLAKE